MAAAVAAADAAVAAAGTPEALHKKIIAGVLPATTGLSALAEGAPDDAKKRIRAVARTIHIQAPKASGDPVVARAFTDELGGAVADLQEHSEWWADAAASLTPVHALYILAGELHPATPPPASAMPPVPKTLAHDPEQHHVDKMRSCLAEVSDMIGNPDRMLIHPDMLAVLRAAFCQGTTGSVPNVAQSWIPDVKRLIILHLGEDSPQYMALVHLAEMSVRCANQVVDLRVVYKVPPALEEKADAFEDQVRLASARAVWEELALIALYLKARQIQRQVYTLDVVPFIGLFWPFADATHALTNTQQVKSAYNTITSPADQKLLQRAKTGGHACHACGEKGHVRFQCPLLVVRRISHHPDSSAVDDGESEVAPTVDGERNTTPSSKRRKARAAANKGNAAGKKK